MHLVSQDFSSDIEPGIAGVSASKHVQTSKPHRPESHMCMFSADATQLRLSAGIRQSNRRLCIWIGCQSRAPVGSHQSRAMKDCALTASEGDHQADECSSGWARKTRIRERHAWPFLVLTSHLSSLIGFSTCSFALYRQSADPKSAN